MEKNKDLLFINYDVGDIPPKEVYKILSKLKYNLETDYVKEHYEVFIFPVRMADKNVEIIAIPSNLSIPSDMLGDQYEEKLDRLTEEMEKLNNHFKEM